MRALLIVLLLAGCAAPLAPEEPAPTTRLRGCSGSGPVAFANSPMRPEDFTTLLPYGLVTGAHVTPIDHMYFEVPYGSPRDAYEVRAVADGVIYALAPRDVNVDTGEAKPREWRMDIAHTCTFATYFDLLTSIAPDIQAAYEQGRMPHAVKAGQLVGRIGGQTLDFAAYDYNVTLPGFVVPEHYDAEPWKVHTADPFPSFDDATRALLLERMLRTAEPRVGRIDHDVDGTLQGNWFAVGTRWYEGLDRSYYWEGHLSLAPAALDPERFILSVGNLSGEARQLLVRGNAPWPADVTPASGRIAYELVEGELVDARTGRGSAGGFAPGTPLRLVERPHVAGTALVEMTGPRSLKLELFPGKAAAEVGGFTAAARAYER